MTRIQEVPQLTQFKIAISAFDCVREHCPATSTTSASQLPAFLVGQIFVQQNAVPSTRIQLGRRSFCVAAPTVWNVLPSQLRSASISRGHTGQRTPLRTFVEKHIILHYIYIPCSTLLVGWLEGHILLWQLSPKSIDKKCWTTWPQCPFSNFLSTVNSPVNETKCWAVAERLHNASCHLSMLLSHSRSFEMTPLNRA